MWTQLGSLTAWELGAALAWTVYCIGSLRSAQLRLRRAASPEAAPGAWWGWRRGAISYGALWMAGFVGTFILLQIVRLPPSSSDASPTVKSAQSEDTSKLPKVASARD